MQNLIMSVPGHKQKSGKANTMSALYLVADLSGLKPEVCRGLFIRVTTWDLAAKTHSNVIFGISVRLGMF